MPSIQFRVGANSIERVLADFDQRRDHLIDTCETTKRLIETILREEEISINAVQARVKAREKLRTKYCKEDKDYKGLDDIRDTVGLRIITYYADELDRVAQIVDQEFEQCTPLEDKRIGKPDSFGYSAIHLDCAYSKARIDSAEYRRFADARFEIQITSILGHAWAEMYHPWYDESGSPSEEMRRFHRLAAVLELADQEFLEIRKRREQRERSAAVRVDAAVPEIPITVESLKAFIDQRQIVSDLDTDLATILGGLGGAPPSPIQLAHLARIVLAAGIETIQALEMKLTNAANAVREYVTLCRPIWLEAQGKLSEFYTQGFSIFHLVNLLMGVPGEERYRAFLQSVEGRAFPRLSVASQVANATQIGRKHGLIER